MSSADTKKEIALVASGLEPLQTPMPMPSLIEYDDLQDLLKASWAAQQRVVTVGGHANTKGWAISKPVPRW